MKTILMIAQRAASAAVLLAWTGCVCGLVGCIGYRVGLDARAIRFESSIHEPETASGTRNQSQVAESGWGDNDEIGVYMVSAGGNIADHSLSINALHKHAGGGNFVADPDHELYYPRVGRVDFRAYYPWRPTRDDHLYPIDIAPDGVAGGKGREGTADNDLWTIDFMFSDNAKGHIAGDVPLLQFRHRLTKLIFNMIDITGASLEGLAATIGGLRTRAVFDLSAGSLTLDNNSAGSIPARQFHDNDDDPTTTVMQAIVLPGTGLRPVVDFALPDGATARLLLVDETYLSGKVYIYNVAVTAGGRVEFAGGTTIVDWDDMDRAPEDYRIPKTDPNDPDDPDNPNNPGPGDAITMYYSEDFSGANALLGDNTLSVNDFTEQTGASANFVDRFGHADIRRTSGLDAHIYLPPGENVDITISGLPADRRDITLSYDVAAGTTGGVAANVVKVFADGVNLSSHVTALLPSPNVYRTVTIDLPRGTTTLRFATDGLTNISGMRLDNICLTGTISD